MKPPYESDDPSRRPRHTPPPLTDNRPKALVELSSRSLLEITLTRLRTFGITEVIVNVHHFADQILAYLESHKNFGMRIESPAKKFCSIPAAA